jgi:hypothetical protein
MGCRLVVYMTPKHIAGSSMQVDSIIISFPEAFFFFLRWRNLIGLVYSVMQ